MTELKSDLSDAVAGGNIFLQVVSFARLLIDGAEAYGKGINAVGGTLANYYGTDTTLEIVAAGNMGA